MNAQVEFRDPELGRQAVEPDSCVVSAGDTGLI